MSHNVAKTVDEIVVTCVRDAQFRLLYRNRLNKIIYKNLDMQGGEVSEGNF